LLSTSEVSWATTKSVGMWSILYLEGHWEAYRVEEDVLDHLRREGITQPVAVVLSDHSAVAFYVPPPGVVL
jgi:hypothetical protein